MLLDLACFAATDELGGCDEQHLDVVEISRKRLSFPDLKRHAIGLARHWNADTLLIEDLSSGTQLLQALLESVWEYQLHNAINDSA